METNILYFKIPQIILREVSESSESTSIVNLSDYYINVPITKTYKKVEDYINIEKDSFKTIIERQNFNPYFIELSFFETIKAISNTGNTMITLNNSNENIEEKASMYSITINK